MLISFRGQIIGIVGLCFNDTFDTLAEICRIQSNHTSAGITLVWLY